MRLRMKHRRALAFTMIEMLIAISIISILAAIAIPSWNQYRMRMKVHEEANKLRSALLEASSLALQKQVAYVVEYSSSDNTVKVQRVWYNFAAKSTGLIDEKGDNRDLRPIKFDQGVRCASDWKLVFADKGWVASGSEGVTIQEVGGYNCYVVNVIAQGVLTLPVRVYPNGRVDIG